jgi:hypothetical protein
MRSSLARKTGGMDRYRFANILRGSGVVHRDSQADKSPPELFEPEQAEDNESVLNHAAWQLVTGNRQLQHSTPSRCQPHRWVYILGGVGKLVMGEPGGKNNHGFLPEVVHAPRRKPPPLGGPSTAGGWLDQKPGTRFVLLLRQWEAPPAIPPSITAGREDCTLPFFARATLRCRKIDSTSQGAMSIMPCVSQGASEGGSRSTDIALKPIRRSQHKRYRTDSTSQVVQQNRRDRRRTKLGRWCWTSL